MQTRTAVSVISCLLLLGSSSLLSQAQQLIWTVGLDDNGWPRGDGGGANASFLQERTASNSLPGNPADPDVDDMRPDDDYYFAGIYSTVIDSVAAAFGSYTPVGPVGVNEDAVARAFAGENNDWRVHFNLPPSVRFDMLTVTVNPYNLDDGYPGAKRYGFEVYFDCVLVQPETVVHATDVDVNVDTDYTTEPFILPSVNAKVGPGYDNIVSLKGINYFADGGGNWMGFDYVQLSASQTPTVIIDGCDSGVVNVLLENGSTISDELASCAASAKNRGAFLSCVAGDLARLLKAKIITGPDVAEIMKCAGSAHIP